ncbi:hypothetical protein HanOQP8_Chr10g0362041 [Helianthus annuus]|nr:hypothetical protein HanOQP8_Chr10g0362041 [Helianthus annuus]KAJ0883406.1 hypothetical protein HanPSC8_Chr10g0421141 [Helianthus annuus]
MKEAMGDEGASLPSNYVTFLDLKQRWLQQQSSSKSKSNPHPHQSNDAGTNQPKQATGSRNPLGRNSNRIVNQLKPDKNPVPRGKNSNPIVNQLKPDDSGSKDLGRNHYRIVNQVKPVHDSGSKTLAQVADDQEHVCNQSKSELKKKKKKKKKRNPRFVTDQKQTRGSTEPEPEKEKKQHGYKGNRVVTDQKQTGPEPVQERKQHGGRRNQEVREPKGKTIPFAQNVDDSVAAAKDRTRLRGSGRFNGGRDSGRFHGMRGSKHPVPMQIWVRKGESEVSSSF